MTQDTTHFGYQTIPKSEKEAKVKDVFDSVASRYDLMNDLMSLGTHRFWKATTIRLAQLRPCHAVLDVACGSADLSVLCAKVLDSKGLLVASDINYAMMSQGYDKLVDAGHLNTRFCQANAQALPFQANTFDRIFMGFGLRNVTEKEEALAQLYRVLKPGGKALVLEFSTPTQAWVHKLYDRYSFRFLPKIGKWVAQDEASYQYLAESIRKHPDQETLKAMFFKAGFDQCTYHNLSMGIVAIHVGIKT